MLLPRKSECYNPNMAKQTASPQDIKALQNRVLHLERLLEISRRLSETLEPQKVLQMVIDSAVELTHSEAASILLHDGESGYLRFVAALPNQWETLRTLRVPLRTSTAGLALITRKPQIVNNISASVRHEQLVDEELKFTTRNLIAVPLLHHNDPIGVIEAVNKISGEYDEEDVYVLQLLAAHAAVALHNARLMEAARRSNEELLRLDKMKSDFIAITSHELRTPLGIILGYATHLSTFADEKCRDSLDAIIRAAMRLRELVEELSDLRNYERGESVFKPQKVDVRELIEETAERYETMAELRGITLSLALPPNPIIAEVDKQKLRTALSHLIKNGIVFTDEGGKVTIGVEDMNDFLRIWVADTGIGIPEDEIPHIFENFYQVEKHLTRHHGGLGIGLTIAKAMVEMHGGTILVESEEGKGSVFTIIIPKKSAESKAVSSVFKT